MGRSDIGFGLKRDNQFEYRLVYAVRVKDYQKHVPKTVYSDFSLLQKIKSVDLTDESI